MMETERPATQNKLAEALHRRVDHLVLSDKARDTIRAGTQQQVSSKAWYGPGLAWAATCLLIVVFGVIRLQTPPPAHSDAHIKCVVVMYADEARTNWSRRTIIVRKTNGTESYIKVVAQKPQQTKGAIL